MPDHLHPSTSAALRNFVRTKNEQESWKLSSARRESRPTNEGQTIYRLVDGIWQSLVEILFSQTLVSNYNDHRIRSATDNRKSKIRGIIPAQSLTLVCIESLAGHVRVGSSWVNDTELGWGYRRAVGQIVTFMTQIIQFSAM